MPVNQQSSLASLSSAEPATVQVRRRVPAWLLPFGLFAGFLLVFGLLFGQRLIPAVPVRVAPVVTIRNENPVDTVETITSSTPTAAPVKTLLFQAAGWIEPDPFSISVSALVGGIVEEVYVLEGENVTKGQALARLIDEDAKLDLAEAAARVETLRSEINANNARIPMVESKRSGLENNVTSEKIKLDEMNDKWQRLQSLPRGSIPAIEVTSAEMQFEQQRARVDQAISDIPGIDSELDMIRYQTTAKKSALREAGVLVAKAKLALDRHVIKSPMNGAILQLHAAPGRKRMIHMDNPKSAYIVELYDPQKIQARIDVPLTEASGISVGQPVEMNTDLLSGLTLKGTVTRITGEADIQRNTLQVKVGIENPDSRLRPEMLVRAKFYPVPAPVSDKKLTTTRTTRGARLSIYVPEEAIFGTDQIWVLGVENTAELRRISLGTDRREKHLLALGGMKSGEKVILPPHTKIKQGIRLKVMP